MQKDTKIWDYHCRIYYEDVDVGGYCYHSKYLNFCERARSEMFFSQDKSPIIGEYHFVAKSLDAKYKKAGVFGDSLVVKTSVANYKKASLVLLHEIYNQDDELIFSMNITLACLKNSQVVKIPQEFEEIFLDSSTS